MSVHLERAARCKAQAAAIDAKYAREYREAVCYRVWSESNRLRSAARKHEWRHARDMKKAGLS